MKKFNGCDFIAGPVHLNGNHWALLFVSLKTKEIYYIDPKGTTEDDLNNIGNKFITFASTNKHLKGIKFSKVLIKHQIQCDMFNCGVFVCYFFQLLVNENFSLFNDQINIYAFRKSILEKINVSSKFTVCCLCKTGQIKKSNVLSQLFSSKLKTLKCKHSFHKECIQNNICIVCNQINEANFLIGE